MENERLRARLQEISELAGEGLNLRSSENVSAADPAGPTEQPEVYELLG